MATLLTCCGPVVTFACLAKTTGAFIKVFAGGLSVPQDLAFGPDGNLYVTNGLGDSVSRFDGTSGASLGLFVPGGAYGLDAPIGLTFGRSEDLYVASFPGNTIFRFHRISGARVSIFNLPYQDGQDTLLRPALFETLRPELFRGETREKSHAVVGRIGPGISVGQGAYRARGSTGGKRQGSSGS